MTALLSEPHHTRFRSLRLRPSMLAALAVVLVCVPRHRTDLGASFQISPADVAASLLIIVAGVCAVRSGRSLPRRAGLMMLPALAVAAATLASQDVLASLPGFLRYLQIFVLLPLAVVVVVRDELDIRLVGGAVIAAAGVQAVLGCWQASTGTGASYGDQNIRAIGTFGAADVMAMSTIVSYGAVLVLALVLSRRGWQQAVALATLALLLTALTLSLSRGAWLACLAAGLVMVVLSGWRRAVGIAVAGSLVLGLCLLGGWGSTALKQRVASVTEVSSQPDRSVNDRYGLWEAAVGMWKDHPVLGVGPRGFALLRDTYAPLQVSAGSDIADPVSGFRRQELRSPHNMYLLVLSEQGLVGLVGFGLMWCGLAVWLVRRMRRPGPVAGRTLALGAAGFLTWQLTNFLYSDIGGAATVTMSVLLGLVLCWLVRPATAGAA